MDYKGYQAKIGFSDDDRVFHGRILGIDDVITFEGTNVDELEQDFRAAVDDYLETCEELGKEPERAYSGRIPLRIDPDLHRKLVIRAELDDMSLNSWIAKQLARAGRSDEAA